MSLYEQFGYVQNMSVISSTGKEDNVMNSIPHQQNHSPLSARVHPAVPGELNVWNQWKISTSEKIERGKY